MSDSLTSLYLTNPQLAVALRQQSMAMPYIQAGMDSSPIRSPWQGLGRMADALVGRVLMNRGNDQIQSAISNQQAAQQQNDADYQRVLAGALTGQPAPSSAPQPTPQAEGVPPTPGGKSVNVPEAWMPYFQEASNRTGIPTQALIAQATQESGMNANAKGQAGEVGVMQIKPSTAKDPGYGLASVDPAALTDPRTNINFGADYLRAKAGARADLSNPTQLASALTAYNGGGDKDYAAHVFQYLPQAYGATQLAQAGNVATDAGPQVGPQGGAAQGGAQGGAMPPTGMNSPNVQRAMEMMQAATQIEMRSPYDPRAKIQAAGLRAQAQAIMGIDTFATGPNGVQVNTRTGQQMNAAAPLPNYHLNPATGAYEAEGQKPVFPPSPRVFQTPSGDVGAVGPNGNITPIAPANNAGVAQRKLAEAQGTEAGKDAPTVKDMVAMGREADQAISNIDYGVNQLHQAAAGGIPTGKAAPWMADAAAWAKSLGVDTRGFGVDPNAVSNVQAGAKTLAVLGGRIIQQAIGPDSQITEGKVQAFVHAHPDLANDPGAIEKILGWARSQYVYNRDMSFDAMKNADKTTGIIPPGWQADYIARKGAFSPIYDPLSKEMKQPEGQGPEREMPQAAPQPQAQPAAPQYREGQTATRGDGHRIIFRGGQWQPM